MVKEAGMGTTGEIRFVIGARTAQLPPITERMAEVMRMYGLTADRLREWPIMGDCEVTLRPGQIALVTGFSGAGKTTALTQMARQLPEGQWLWLGRDGCAAESKASVIDALGGKTREALS